MSERADELRPRTTVVTLQQKKERGEHITMLTAYDHPTARFVDAAGIDAVLVGDSLAMVVLGHPTTLPVTMDEMLHHARAVSRGAPRALRIGDLPFMSYQADDAEAVRNAGRFLKEAAMDAVKLEGGRDVESTVRAITRAGVPVMGHIGLRPQSIHQLGGFRTQARTAASACALLDDALRLEDAGCFALVLECVPARVAASLTTRVRIPTLGIGSGPGTDGQVLVLHDLLGLTAAPPRFVQRYAELGRLVDGAIAAFRRDVESGGFPREEHSASMPDDEWDAFSARLAAPLDRAAPR